jgi:transposase-like protein
LRREIAFRAALRVDGLESRQAERDAGTRAGLTTEERERLKQLERENFELRRTNEILRLASAYFAKAELDRRHK